MSPLKVGIVGGSGFVAGELIRCLIHHPEVEIDFIYSHSHPGENAHLLHPDLAAHAPLAFSDQVNPGVEVLFLCLGHGNSRRFLETHSFSPTTKIIDLSNDFRLQDTAHHGDMPFVYGLVEAHQEKIAQARYIANPGCFATAIQLALLPLAQQQQLLGDVHIHAITGATGAGKSLRETTHFSWRSNNVSVYKPFQHQHLGEISETLEAFQPGFGHALNFLPIRGNFTRGIFASVYLESDLSASALKDCFQSCYHEAVFTHVVDHEVDLKQVVNTNHCFLQVQKVDNKVLIVSVIDNLLKGAAGQAIQNMNLMCGMEEDSGLQLKASYF